MADGGVASIGVTLDRLYKRESRRIRATLVRFLGDLDLAEDALQEAFAAATERWPDSGVPEKPVAWLITAGRFRGIDAIRRRSRLSSRLPVLAADERTSDDPADTALEAVPDDQLRLIFLCCNPGLPVEARLALTLREVCGLTTEEIARAFLSKPATIAQRIVRAKAKIREGRFAYSIPDEADLPERLDTVLQAIYLVYNEGYAATTGDMLTGSVLSREAIRLGRLLVGLLPEPEAKGLLALMLLHDARREARATAQGEIILLEDQDRSLWDSAQIAEGAALARRAMSGPVVGEYAIQAAIAAEHATARSAAATRWDRIVALYDLLRMASPSPVVDLNRAVAIAMRDGASSGLELVDELLAEGSLEGYHLAYSARGEFARRLGMVQLARKSFERAIELATQEPERRFLVRRLEALR